MGAEYKRVKKVLSGNITKPAEKLKKKQNANFRAFSFNSNRLRRTN